MPSLMKKALSVKTPTAKWKSSRTSVKKLYTKEETCETFQNRLLNNIRVKLTYKQHEYLDKFINEN